MVEMSAQLYESQLGLSRDDLRTARAAHREHLGVFKDKKKDD